MHLFFQLFEKQFTEFDLQPTIIFKFCHILWLCCYLVPKFSLNFSFVTKVIYEYDP